MRLNLKRAAVGLALGAGLVIGAAVPAGATADPNKGQDSKADVSFQGGSDTTYEVETRLSTLYNQSPGCATNNSFAAGPPDNVDSKNYPISAPTAGNLAQCNSTVGDPKLNFDHDTIVEVYPTGSGAGINAVNSGDWQGGRSSRVLTGTELGTMNAVGFAKDGITVETYGTKVANAAGFTKAQLVNIYSCNGTRSDANGSGLYSYNDLFADGDNTLIHPYGIQTSSGTYSTFKTYLGGPDPSPTAAPGTNCVEPIGNPGVVTGASYAFENASTPVLNDASAKGINANGVLWWSSFGVFNTYGVKRVGATYWNVDGFAPQTSTIANGTYPINRILYKVIANAVLQPTGTNGSGLLLSTTGATSGQAGAMRAFTEWACQPNTGYFDSAPTNPYTGNSYFTDITSSISAEGFQRVPNSGGQRNFGVCQLAT